MQIADEMKPNAWAIKTLRYLAYYMPTWRLTPTPDIVGIAFRDPNVQKEVNYLYNLLFVSDRLMDQNLRTHFIFHDIQCDMHVWMKSRSRSLSSNLLSLL